MDGDHGAIDRPYRVGKVVRCFGRDPIRFAVVWVSFFGRGAATTVPLFVGKDAHATDTLAQCLLGTAERSTQTLSGERPAGLEPLAPN
jgi:hypothetical protein